MSDSQSNLEDTQPKKLKKFNLSPFWISLLVVVGAILLGALSGAGLGFRTRISVQQTQVAQTLGDQFQLAQQDIAAGRYDTARERLAYIIQKQPDFPGASDTLAQVIVKQSITATPTVTPSPTLTPTPDLRQQQAIFAQAQQQIANKDWTNALATLDTLRKKDSTYKAAQVDDMYYTALRNRGVDEILGQGDYAQTTNLEGGIYDLTLAERFGPLDGQADGLRNFARVYIIGASFWDLDWSQAVNYFGQIYQYVPNLRDASNVTATERYRIALLNYADQLLATSKPSKQCDALDYYEKSFSIKQDPAYVQKVNDLYQTCHPPTKTPAPTQPAATQVSSSATPTP